MVEEVAVEPGVDADEHRMLFMRLGVERILAARRGTREAEGG